MGWGGRGVGAVARPTLQRIGYAAAGMDSFPYPSIRCRESPDGTGPMPLLTRYRY